jgi:hypothetical protein
LNFRKTFSAVLLILLFVFDGCLKPEEFQQPAADNNFPGEEGLYGKKLEDPHAIHNIARALESLKAAGVPVPPEVIKPNHTYIRFLPASEQELSLLENDSTLVLYDYPLNYEFTGEESDIDPADDTSPLQWQYCVLPAWKTLPAVHYEIIYEVFIPAGEESTTKSTSEDHAGFYDELIYESARLTGNLEPVDTTVFQSKGFLQSKWIPKGRIRVWDDLLDQYIPLEHVNVHARWFTHIETGLTDEEGYFRLKSFRNKVNYSIKWENTLFTIRNGVFLQAWYNGPRMKGDWALNIRDGRSVMYATIHRAAYKHFYGDNLGIFRPTLLFGARTKISYRDYDGTGKFLRWSVNGISPNIQIWGKSEGKYRKTNEVFGTTAHELGHQSHQQYIGAARYRQTSRIIRESWAEAVEWALTNDEYHKLGNKFNNIKAASFNHHYYKHSSWPHVSDRDYSPIFIDLADNINQRLLRGADYPNDLISDYSIAFINNNILMNATDISSLRTELTKNLIEGVDDFCITELFQLY